VLGNTADAGGVYLTLPVPFASSITVNATLAAFDSGPKFINAVMR
jgi:hypothetical protein